MICGICDKTDNDLYLSDPPQYKCTITGNFHSYFDECECVESITTNESIPTTESTATSESITTFLEKTEINIEASCIVCGEGVELTEEEVMSLNYGNCIHSKVCDKCKEAILYMRSELEESEMIRKVFERLPKFI